LVFGSNNSNAALLNACSSYSTSTTLSSQGDKHVSPPKAWQEACAADGSRFWNDLGGGHFQRPIFVAATRQHVGKTTTSLAIMSGLQKHFHKVAFLKPVGQQHVTVPGASGSEHATLQVDKDVCLVKEHFQLHHIDYEDMSPVIIPAGYTKRYVDGEISMANQVDDVLRAMDHLTQRSDVVLCEGTGHCAVGSIVGINNAKIASMVGDTTGTFVCAIGDVPSTS
jgi:hypothetical protein